MPKPNTLDKYQDTLFSDLETLGATALEQQQILRYRRIFTERLASPSQPNKVLVDMLQEEFCISAAQAYRDIAQMEVLLGKIRNAEKSWMRYTVIETCKEAIELARLNEDVKTMVAAAATLGKYCRLDQEDAQPLPYEDIVPQPVEFVNDPQLLGLPKVDNPRAVVERAKKKYLGAMEVEYQEVERKEHE